MSSRELRKDPVLNRWVLIAPPPSSGAECAACAAIGELGEAAAGVVKLAQPVFDRRSVVDRSIQDPFMSMNAAGEHELIVETRAHGVRFSALEDEAIRDVLALWRERFLFFRQDNRFRHAVIVKREGEGAIAPGHACSEAFALPLVPPSVKEKLVGIQGARRKSGGCVYCELVRHERQDKTRKVAESMRHLAIAPYASRVPFELLVLPKGHHFDFALSTPEDLADLASLLGEVLERLERAVAGVSYALYVQTAPPDMGSDLEQFHWHLEILPRVARAEALNGVLDTCTLAPEEAARLLREVSV